jgi:two-component system OmpR family sensor kinase
MSAERATGTGRRLATSAPASRPDSDLVRDAARRVGWQISIACALVVVVVAVLAFVLGPLLHPSRPPHLDGYGGVDAVDGDNDALIRDALLIAGIVGIVIAGLVGFFSARRAVAPLGEALALQRRFVADAGHELRTPLTVLYTRAQLLARRMGPDDPARATVEQLLADSRVLGEIVDEMLESAALAADASRGEPLDPAALSAEVVASMGVLATAAGVTLTGESVGTAQVRGSRSALRRALTALADNALAHTPAGGHVVIETVARGHRVLISVTDDGEGLAGDDADRLTERFARGLGSGGGVGGARRFGLGLSLVREVATAHGGTLTLAGAPGAGVRATIDLPADL